MALCEKEMATHSSILAWRIPWTEEHDRLQSMGLQRFGHDSVTSLYGPVSILSDGKFTVIVQLLNRVRLLRPHGL